MSDGGFPRREESKQVGAIVQMRSCKTRTKLKEWESSPDEKGKKKTERKKEKEIGSTTLTAAPRR